MSQTRIIGRVLSVDNFRVFVKIEEDLQGSFKNGLNDIYEVARINSYLIIPVGSDRIVALITRVSMKDEIELEKNTTSITLPQSARYISATMLGTIAKKGELETFIQGVYSFPSLDNPVWYVTEKELDYIFDNTKGKNEIDFANDYYLPIGTSPAFQNYKVKICPDQFFVKHAAILGNTGSGKSCTLTSILRNLFRFNYNGKKLTNAHFVIFDTNGEYKDAFIQDENEELKNINAYYYGGEDNVKVPYWLMNWKDFKALLKPSEGTQAPILNKAIGFAKNEQEISNSKTLSFVIQNEIEQLLNCTADDIKKRTWLAGGTWKWNPDNNILKLAESILPIYPELGKEIKKIGIKDNFNNLSIIDSSLVKIDELYKNYIETQKDIQITSTLNIDLPIWFSYQDLCTKYLDSVISQEGNSNKKLNEYISTLRLRMSSFLNDKRIAIPLMLKDSETIQRNILPQFLSLILGDYNKCFAEKDEDNFIKTYNNNSHQQNTKKNQITIVDVSRLPYEILETVTGLIGHLILDFVSNFLPTERGKFPIVLVLEEAQNYIAENKESISKEVFERIAREGRKYGISLIVSSQRPSELSKTVLSQCNSFIIHRLQNPDDQKYVKGLISSANADLLEQLPIIPQQHAIITGDCVRTPIQVRIDDVSPTPNSHNPEYINQWLNQDSVIPYEDTCNRWIGK